MGGTTRVARSCWHNAASDVRQGEEPILLGENSAGQLTLLKIISGADVKDCGSI